MASMPDFAHESALHDLGAAPVAGVDEAGRGPLAGPVVAAAVVLDPANLPPGLNDSKKLSPAQRNKLARMLAECAEIGVGTATVAEIDQINILRAAHLAMIRALDALPRRAAHALIDGNMVPDGLDLPATALIKGDARSLSVAAASIIAKVERDRVMVDLAQHFPGYGWEKNAGYPTSVHLRALQEIGVTPHHRRSFKPVHNILCRDKSLTS